MWAPGATVPTDLGTLDGKDSAGIVVNDDHVVGGYAFASGGTFNALRVDPVTHAVTDMGSVGDGFTAPFAINAKGTIVGISHIRAVRFVVGTGPTSP